MKHYRVVILPAALNDIRKAKDWYNEQQKGLGARFTKTVRATVRRVAHYPYHSMQFDTAKPEWPS